MTDATAMSSLPAIPLRYRFVSVHRIIGFSGLPNEQALPIPVANPGVTAILTRDPNSALAEVDRGAALGLLMLMGFQGMSANDDILKAVRAMAEERAQERAKKHDPDSVFLLVEVRGEIHSTATDTARDLAEAVLACDAVDKRALQADQQPLISAVLTAVALTLNTSAGIAPVLEGVALTLHDGRPLYSLTFTGGTARITISRPATNHDAHTIEAATRGLLEDQRLMTPLRLLVDSLRRTGDRLEAFILAWAALEILIGKYASGCENGAWVTLVPTERRMMANAVHVSFTEGDHRYYSLRDRFRVFAITHGLERSAEVGEEIARIRKTFREPLFHEGVIDEQGLPVERVAELVRVLMRSVLNIPNSKPSS